MKSKFRLSCHVVASVFLLACQTLQISRTVVSDENPAFLNRDICENLGKPNTQPVKSYLKFELPTERTHSMSYALPNYVCGKIPCLDIENTVNRGGTIRVVGLPPEILKLCKVKLGLPEFRNNPFSKQKAGKRENVYRPVFYSPQSSGSDLVVSVMAGEDYIQQVAGMIAFQIEKRLNRSADEFVTVDTYPKVENGVAGWTDLQEFVNPQDTVLMGNVAFFSDYVREKISASPISETENYFYKSTRVKVGLRTLNFLIVKHTFWGSLSGRLVEDILKKRVFEVIYMSKVATLKSPEDIYYAIYAPSKFYALKQGHIEQTKPLENQFAKFYPEFNSGTHVSVPTVIEEDVMMTEQSRSVGATSLDLEVVHFVKAIEEANATQAHKTRFGAVHIVTDYLRSADEIDRETSFDLSNSGSAQAAALKKKSWNHIYEKLLRYLQSRKT